MEPKVFADFTGGMDSTADKGLIPPDRGRVFNGIEPLPEGGFIVTKIPGSIFTSAVTYTRLFRYVTSPTQSYLYLTRIITAGGPTYYNVFDVRNEVANTTAADAITTTTGSSQSLQVDIQFAQYKNYLYITDPNDRLLVAQSSIIGEAGLPEPDTYPGVTISGAVGSGNLNTVDATLPYYQWVYCFYNIARNVLSNPSDACNRLVGVDDQSVDLVPVGGSTGLPTTIAAIDEIWWFRRGGNSGDYYYSGKCTVTAGAWTAATFTDTTADLDQTTQVVNYNNGQPPIGLNIIHVHKSRLFGAIGDSTTLWFSALDRPECFGIDSGLDTDGGYINLPGGLDDGILTLSDTGGLLVIGRAQSVYVLYGNQFADFALSPRANVGVIGRRAMSRAYNDVYYMGRDKRVYRISEGGNDWVSQAIQKELDLLSQSVCENVCVTFAEGKLCLYFTTGTAYFLHLRAPKTFWTTETISGTVNDMKGAPHPTEKRDEFIYTGVNLVSRLFSTVGTKTISYASGYYEAQQQDGVGKFVTRAENLYANGTVVGSSPALSATVAVDLPTTTYTRSYPFTAASYDLLNTRCHPDLIGRFFELRVTGTCDSGTVIGRLSLASTLRRGAN